MQPGINTILREANDNELLFAKTLKQAPVIAILRGVNPENVVSIAQRLVEIGIKIIEVPLNSPSPFQSIEKLTCHFADSILCGAGTVITTDDVIAVHGAGGRIVLSPHSDPKVIGQSVDCGLVPIPGIATPTEALLAIASGARYLKVFPANCVNEKLAAALKQVVPEDIGLIPVGGVCANNLAQWLSKGAAGVGVGSELFNVNDDEFTFSIKIEKMQIAISKVNRPLPKPN